MSSLFKHFLIEQSNTEGDEEMDEEDNVDNNNNNNNNVRFILRPPIGGARKVRYFSP